MLYADLPDSEHVGYAITTVQLADCFQSAMGKSTGLFSYIERAVDGPRSCRLLFEVPSEEFTHTVAFPEPYNFSEMAKEFFREDFMEQSRWEGSGGHGEIKGWEVDKAESERYTFIIVRAAWVRLTDHSL